VARGSNSHKADIQTVAANVRFGGTDMPTHFAYLKRIAPVYCRFEPDSRYLRVQFAKKMQFVSEFEVPMPPLVASNVVKSGFIGTIG
jgi:hypothetical protein